MILMAKPLALEVLVVLMYIASRAAGHYLERRVRHCLLIKCRKLFELKFADPDREEGVAC